MKFALILIAALCVLQGFEARSFHSNNFIDIGDAINKLIEHFMGWISEIEDWVSDTFEKIVQRIQDKLEEINDKIVNIKNEIKEKIKKLIDGTVKVIEDCMKTNENELNDIVNQYKTDQELCMKEANENMKSVSDSLPIIYQEADNLRYIIASAVHCKTDSSPYQCMLGQWDKFTKAIKQLYGDCHIFLDETTVIIKKTAEDLNTCEQGVAEKVGQLEEALMGKMKQCVVEHKDD